MTSRRKFLSSAFGIAYGSATTWPIRANQARSMQGQSNTGRSKAGRTTRKTSLRWDVFLAPSIPAIASDLPPGEKQRPWPPISSTLISGERDAVLVDTWSARDSRKLSFSAQTALAFPLPRFSIRKPLCLLRDILATRIRFTHKFICD
jgi:hypothetical protein